MAQGLVRMILRSQGLRPFRAPPGRRVPRVETVIFVNILEERWKLGKRLSRARNRTQAYAPLFSGLSSDLPEPSSELSSCTRNDDATA
jgi:hypothetical protein